METQKIIRLLQKSFNGSAWHGPAVMEVLTTITPKEAARKMSASHSIIELVLHMAVWRDFVSKRLQGNNEFEVSEEENFPKETGWTVAMKTLQHSQDELIKSINQFPEEKLTDLVPTRTYDFYTMLYGIIQHDIYHTGQIVLLKKVV